MECMSDNNVLVHFICRLSTGSQSNTCFNAFYSLNYVGKTTIINWAYDVGISVEKHHEEILSAIFLPENSVSFVKGNEQSENAMLNRR